MEMECENYFEVIKPNAIKVAIESCVGVHGYSIVLMACTHSASIKTTVAG